MLLVGYMYLSSVPYKMYTKCQQGTLENDFHSNAWVTARSGRWHFPGIRNHEFEPDTADYTYANHVSCQEIPRWEVLLFYATVNDIVWSFCCDGNIHFSLLSGIALIKFQVDLLVESESVHLCGG